MYTNRNKNNMLDCFVAPASPTLLAMTEKGDDDAGRGR